MGENFKKENDLKMKMAAAAQNHAVHDHAAEKLDDEALEAAAGGGLYVPPTNQRCYYCGRTGDLTQKRITPWNGPVYGYGTPYDVWVCASCRNANKGGLYEKPFV